MKTAIIQLDQFDNVISINEKISWGKSQRVLLVWPDKGKIDLKPLDVLLVLRFAEDLGTQIAIVSDDPVIMIQMKEIGISCFLSIPEAQKKPWRKPRIKNRSVKLKLEDQDRPKLDSVYRGGNEQIQLSKKIRWLIFILGLIATLIVILIFIPSATIIIYPEPVNQEIEMSFHAGPTITETNLSGSIPIQRVTIVVEEEFVGTSSGMIRVPSKKATGKVIFTNLTDNEIIIPKGTIVRTNGDPEIRFETTQDTNLMAGIDSEIEVPIISFEAGTKGNVSQGSIVFSESEFNGEVAIYNQVPTNGGTSITTLAPTNLDYEKLKEDSINLIKSAAVAEIRNQYSDVFLIPTDRMEIIQYLSEERIPEVGYPADQIRLRIEAEVSAWVILEEDVEITLKSALETDLPEMYMPVNDHIEIKIVNDSILFQNQSLWWNVVANREIIPEIQQEVLIQSILGKGIDTAKDILENEIFQYNEPDIFIYPKFWKFLPYLPFQINLEVHD